MTKTKYKSCRITIDEIKFTSKKEVNYYNMLKKRQTDGDIKYFLRQVPFDLGGGVNTSAIL